MFAVVETIKGDTDDLLRRFDEVVSSHQPLHPGRLLHLCLASAEGITIINVFDTEDNALAHATNESRLRRVHSAGLDPTWAIERIHRSRGFPTMSDS